MIPFIEKTWFLWWVVAVSIILRWFHLLSTTAENAPEAFASEEEQAKAMASSPPSTASVGPTSFAA